MNSSQQDSNRLLGRMRTENAASRGYSWLSKTWILLEISSEVGDFNVIIPQFKHVQTLSSFVLALSQVLDGFGGCKLHWTNLKLKSALFIISISLQKLPTLGSTGIHNMFAICTMLSSTAEHAKLCSLCLRKFQASGLSAAKEASAPVPKLATTIQGPMSQVLMLSLSKIKQDKMKIEYKNTDEHMCCALVSLVIHLISKNRPRP